MPPVSDWAFMLKNDVRKKKFEEIPTDTELLITHTPPSDILDAKPNAEKKHHHGCVHLREEVLTRIKPLYHMFGHCHDGYGQTQIDGINFINAATCDEDYAPVQPPIYFEIPSKET